MYFLCAYAYMCTHTHMHVTVCKVEVMDNFKECIISFKGRGERSPARRVKTEASAFLPWAIPPSPKRCPCLRVCKKMW